MDVEVSGSISKTNHEQAQTAKCFSTTDLVRHLVTILRKKKDWDRKGRRTEVNNSMVRHAFTELNTYWHAVNTSAHIPLAEPTQLPHTHPTVKH